MKWEVGADELSWKQSSIAKPRKASRSTSRLEGIEADTRNGAEGKMLVLLTPLSTNYLRLQYRVFYAEEC